ncbi:uncharacterized protein STEHIDRAFT_51088 [Stereum hirsutum FP-91666 SS1]|uniref:uncharacterized protein n=1 Tax=Stereum hirsutum (strain FP-91666) TaxID=721885 RepID=UPI000440C732|nr:uncharacterized protein STEHIDRAFT_51088 [Stereum hirsutum FP-91666 SS1]EIM89452.1 hypothetical protein STEHIDRAFT_51088 [Stereum hirsutum FP-91666 SS1]
MTWLNTGSNTKTPAETNRIVEEIINGDGFKQSDFKDFDAVRETKRYDASEEGLEGTAFADGFVAATVEIEVPSGDKTKPSRWFSVPGLHYRPILSVIKAAFAEPLAAHFHYSPFEVWWKSTVSGKDERVYGELYNSTAWLEEDEKVQRRAPPDPSDPSCKREKILAGVMLWSDSTHLANFGTAKLWPIYLFLGNLSKYLRAMPTSGACQHLAYIPSLPDSFDDWISGFNEKWKTQQSSILAHCRRELMHAVWKLLLDSEFIHAYTYGVVIKCLDGIERRVFPRFFTYSADYPEKILLASIRDNGLCPCPRCLVPKSELDRVGFIHDFSRRVSRVREYLLDKVILARDCIYNRGFGIKSAAVERVLKATSSAPTMNAFIEKFGPDFSLSRLLVVDLLHEIELGVWKALFTHLIRVLYAAGVEKVSLLNSRYVVTVEYSALTFVFYPMLIH